MKLWPPLVYETGSVPGMTTASEPDKVYFIPSQAQPGTSTLQKKNCKNFGIVLANIGSTLSGYTW